MIPLSRAAQLASACFAPAPDSAGITPLRRRSSAAQAGASAEPSGLPVRRTRYWRAGLARLLGSGI